MEWVRLQRVKKWLETMEERRRALFFLMSVLLFYIAWFLFLHQPLQNFRQTKIKMAHESQNMLTNAEGKIGLLEKKRRYQEVMMGEVQQSAADVQRLIDTSPSSDRLRAMLAQAVTNQPGIQFVELTIDPPSPWFPVAKISPSYSKQAEYLRRFQIHIHFRGGYLDTLHFLVYLTEQPWHLYWETLEYKVEKYPSADVVVSFSVPALEVPT